MKFQVVIGNGSPPCRPKVYHVSVISNKHSKLKCDGRTDEGPALVDQREKIFFFLSKLPKRKCYLLVKLNKLSSILSLANQAAIQRDRDLLFAVEIFITINFLTLFV